MKKIIKNAIRCKKCGDIIESESTHDFKWCSCKSVAVDGGLHYLRRVGFPDDWEELSEHTEVPGHYVKCVDCFGIAGLTNRFLTDMSIQEIVDKYGDCLLTITDENGNVEYCNYTYQN